MRLCLMLCLMLLAACGDRDKAPAVYVPADLFSVPKGWTGRVPDDAGTMADATAAEIRAKEQCIGQLLTVRDIVLPQSLPKP